MSKRVIPLTRTSVFLTDKQVAALRAINDSTGIPLSVLIRQGVDLIIQRHRKTSR